MTLDKTIVLVTGSAGFIGAALVNKLLSEKAFVVGVDNHNSYYDPILKRDRLSRFIDNPNYSHYCEDIKNLEVMTNIFSIHNPSIVINLAAQAGVRHSIDQPQEFVNTNIGGFVNILECCRHFNVERLIYASSSSVYGDNAAPPFSVYQDVNKPLSLYAASKRSNELMAYSYNQLFQLKSSGIRFFTVYGPWGRPDMALFKFTKAILGGYPIEVFNNGNHSRDFTYIDDIIEGIIRVIGLDEADYKIHNLGNSQPVQLLEFIKILEGALGKKAQLILKPLQKGDLHETFADMTDFNAFFDFKPSTTIQSGILNFISWYRDYYKC